MELGTEGGKSAAQPPSVDHAALRGSWLVGCGFARAKFRVRMLLICLKLQNGVLRALGQHGKLFRCGTLEI